MRKFCFPRMNVSFVALVFIAGCASPSPNMMNANKVEVFGDGVTFTVFFDEAKAEVIRTGFASDRRGMRAQMISAVYEATSCEVNDSSVRGDDTVLRMELDCSNVS